MTRADKLKPIHALMLEKETDAAQVMSQARTAVSGAEAKLVELISFRGEYQKRFNASMTNGLVPARIRDFQLFLQRLDLAIDEQRKQIENAKMHCQSCESEWLRLRSKSKAIETVVDRYKSRDEQEQLRREQKELDEFAMQARFRIKH